jgi:hypothetical protein
MFDQQDPFAHHFVRNTVEHREHDGGDAGSKERRQVDPGLDGRDAHERIQPLESGT